MILCNSFPKKYEENLISELDITPKVCICIQRPPKPTSIAVIINLLDKGMAVVANLFTPLVTSNIPEIMLLDNSIGRVGIIIFAIKLVIYNFSRIVEMSEKTNINPPMVQTVMIEFLIILLSSKPSSFNLTILKLSLLKDCSTLFFLKKRKTIPTIMAEK